MRSVLRRISAANAKSKRPIPISVKKRITLSEQIATKVMGLLAQLGDDEMSVANVLKGVYCKGRQRADGGCPIANYLDRHMYGYRLVVRKHKVLIYVRIDNYTVERDYRGKLACIVNLPEACYNFITAFDSGKYPKLRDDYSKRWPERSKV